MVEKATVVGIGAMGTVVARILATNGVNVALLARDSEHVQEIFVQRENRVYLPNVDLTDLVTPTNNAEGGVSGYGVGYFGDSVSVLAGCVGGACEVRAAGRTDRQCYQGHRDFDAFAA